MSSPRASGVTVTPRIVSGSGVGVAVVVAVADSEAVGDGVGVAFEPPPQAARNSAAEVARVNSAYRMGRG